MQDVPRDLLELLDDLTLDELLDVAEGRMPLPPTIQQTLARRAYNEIRLSLRVLAGRAEAAQARVREEERGERDD